MTTATRNRFTPAFLRAFRFFLAHAGYATPPGRIACARDLAVAEMWLADHDELEIDIQEDERAYCYCDDPHCPYHEGNNNDWDTVIVAIVKPCPEHGISCKHSEWLASLGGIIETGNNRERDNYRRVVIAELAAEVMGGTDADLS